MKLLHIADLHLGKKLGGYSLIEDQRYFLNKTISYMKENSISHLLIAGDIYDISSPSGEAISLFDEFLNDLKKNNIKTFIISGNHDSNERVGYGNKLFTDSNIYINTDIKNAISPISVDGINYYLIPFTTASEINATFNQEFKTYDEAMAYVISLMKLDKSKVNIALSHQLVLPSGKEDVERGGSEDLVVGTLQNISSSVYKDFTYVALGHIHKPQKVADNAYYSGSPLAYHVDEAKFDKTLMIIELEDNKVNITKEKIVPLRKVVELKGDFTSILANHKENVNDYVYATIDGPSVENAMAKLKEVYPYAVGLRYKVVDAKGVDLSKVIQEIEKVTPEELFTKLYLEQTGVELTSYQKKVVAKLLKEEE